MDRIDPMRRGRHAVHDRLDLQAVRDQRQPIRRRMDEMWPRPSLRRERHLQSEGAAAEVDPDEVRRLVAVRSAFGLAGTTGLEQAGGRTAPAALRT
jgi:hypothetical protein